MDIGAMWQKRRRVTPLGNGKGRGKLFSFGPLKGKSKGRGKWPRLGIGKGRGKWSLLGKGKRGGGISARAGKGKDMRLKCWNCGQHGHLEKD